MLRGKKCHKASSKSSVIFTAVHQMFTQAAFALLHLASSLLSFKSLLLVQLLSLCMMHRPL